LLIPDIAFEPTEEIFDFIPIEVFINPAVLAATPAYNVVKPVF
jgi:hypothetical protein